MTLGALEALSLSSAVIQFIDFASKVVSKGHKLYHGHDGNLLEYNDLDASARQILKLNNAIIDGFESASRTDPYQSGGSIPIPQEISVKEVCRNCNRAASKLHNTLDALKVKGRMTRWRSFRAAIKSEWGKSAVDALKNDLDLQRNLLNTTLLVSLKYNMQDVLKVLTSKQSRPQWQKDVANKARGLRDDQTGDIASFGYELTKAAQAASLEQMQLQILRQLDFRDRLDRHNRIPVAHTETFQWIFASQEELLKRDFKSFADWLGGDDNLYWITGKPGSGKSTLMKFIVSDQRTRQHLKFWSRGVDLITASFYFWNSGSDVQMSLLGLLRTLLCDMLYACPALIPEVFADRWSQTRLVGEALQPWTEEELLGAFKATVEKLTNTRKVCLFIDGLDEFSGQHEQLVQVVDYILRLKNVKICLASRPWSIFDDAYGRRTNLMLQNLTFDDIKRYAEANLCNSRGFEALQRSEPDYAVRLVQQIADKASGVYLWVSLVVESLLRGMTNRDRLQDLERRLGEIPGDLEELYQNILDSIEPFYLSHASQLFQLIREGKGEYTALTLSFADESLETALKAGSEPLSDNERNERYETMKIRLNSRCKGLLEVPTFTADEYAMPNVGPAANIESETKDSYMPDTSIPFDRESVTADRDLYIRGNQHETSILQRDLTYRPRPRARQYGRRVVRESESYLDHNSSLPDEMDPPRPEAPIGTDLLWERSRRPLDMRPVLNTTQRVFQGRVQALPAISIPSRRSRLYSQGLQSMDIRSPSRSPPPHASRKARPKTDGAELRSEPFHITNDSFALLANRKIAYLHRTARDFLEKPEIWNQILKNSSSEFVLYKAMLASMIRQLKCISNDTEGAITLSGIMHKTLQYLGSLEKQGILSIKWTAEMAEVMRVAVAQCQSPWIEALEMDKTITEIRKHGERAFLALAAEYPLHGFVHQKLLAGVLILPDQEHRSLLDCVVADYAAYSSLCDVSCSNDHPLPNFTLIQRLLGSGADPNQVYKDRTPWTCVLRDACKTSADESIELRRKTELLSFWADVVEEFIKHNANPFENRNANNGNALRAAFGSTMPDRSRQLELRLEKSKKKLSRLGQFFLGSHSSKSMVDTMPLFRLRQLQAAQIPGLSAAEHFRQKQEKKAKSTSDNALKPFVH